MGKFKSPAPSAALTTRNAETNHPEPVHTKKTNAQKSISLCRHDRYFSWNKKKIVVKTIVDGIVSNFYTTSSVPKIEVIIGGPLTKLQ